MFLARSVAICVLAASLYAQPQPDAIHAILEVASVRQHSGAREFSDLSTSGTKVTVSALTLREVIANAYRLRGDQIIGGSKLQDADISGNNPGLRMTANGAGKHIVSWHSTMQQLALLLSGTAGRPVVDKTGLSEKYAFHLDWNPTDAPDSDIPSIFTAVQQQLGLRLESQRAPFEVLVIDSVDRPSAN
jgi:hypothetical protein